MSDATGTGRSDDELRELLSAYADDELTPEEATEVEGFVARSPDAATELEGLGRVRMLVRDLPAVDPPFGFYERMLRDAKKPAHSRRLGFSLGAAAAAAAAVVLIIGVTPAADSVVPPVKAYAEHHDEMAAAPTTVVGGVPCSSANAASCGHAAGSVPGASASAPANVTWSAGGVDFTPTEPKELDAVPAPFGAPSTLAPGYDRIYGERGSGNVWHIVYSNGVAMVSVFEQVGVVDWSALPGEGSRLQVDGDPAWKVEQNGEDVIVVNRGRVTYTFIMVADADVVPLIEAMPDPPDPSITDRVQHTAEEVVQRFGFSD